MQLCKILWRNLKLASCDLTTDCGRNDNSKNLTKSKMSMPKIYKSKIGLELVIPIALILGTVFILTISNEPSWLGVLILLPVILFMIYMFMSTFYVVDNEVLIIKSGFLYDDTINIKTIRKISETHNLLSSPATSLDRLEITYNKYDSVLISPKDKLLFIENLTSLNPSIEVKLKNKK